MPSRHADVLGWRAQAAALAEIHHSLSPAEQRDAVIATGNDGESRDQRMTLQ